MPMATIFFLFTAIYNKSGEWGPQLPCVNFLMHSGIHGLSPFLARQFCGRGILFYLHCEDIELSHIKIRWLAQGPTGR